MMGTSDIPALYSNVIEALTWVKVKVGVMHCMLLYNYVVCLPATYMPDLSFIDMGSFLDHSSLSIRDSDLVPGLSKISFQTVFGDIKA
jgi:hypothetical protein